MNNPNGQGPTIVPDEEPQEFYLDPSQRLLPDWVLQVFETGESITVTADNVGEGRVFRACLDNNSSWLAFNKIEVKPRSDGTASITINGNIIPF